MKGVESDGSGVALFVKELSSNLSRVFRKDSKAINKKRIVYYLLMYHKND